MLIKKEKIIGNVGKPKRRSLMLVAAAGAISYITSPQKAFGSFFLFNGYSRDFSFSFSYPGVWTRGSTMAKAADGGYVIAVDIGESSNLVKLDGFGKQQWVSKFIGSDKGSHFEGKSVCADGNHGYLLIGETNSHDLLGKSWDEAETKRTRFKYDFTPKMALLSRVDTHGKLVWQKIYGKEEIHARNSAQFTLPVKDSGFLVFGFKTAQLPASPLIGEFNKLESPWIFKIDANGDMLSETLIQEINGAFVKRPAAEDIYSKPIIDPDGNLIVVVRTDAIQIVTDRNGTQKLDIEQLSGRPIYILLKLNQDGKELARYQLNRETAGIPVILASSTGIDMFRLHDEDNSSDKRLGFVHFHFDPDLKLISEKFISDQKFRPKAAIKAVGGFHMFGSDVSPGNDRGQAVLAFLKNDGGLECRTGFGRDSWPNDLIAGHNENEVLVFYNTSSSDVVKVEKFSLKI